MVSAPLKPELGTYFPGAGAANAAAAAGADSTEQAGEAHKASQLV